MSGEQTWAEGEKIPAYRAPKPIRPGVVNFEERIRHTCIHFLNNRRPHHDDLEKWIVSPLYQHDRDVPLENDGRTSMILMNVDVLRHLLKEYDERIENEKKKEKRPASKTSDYEPSAKRLFSDIEEMTANVQASSSSDKA